MTANARPDALAVCGGPRVRLAPWPARRSFGQAEKEAAVAVLDAAIADGRMVPYGGEQEQAYCREFAEALGGGFADAVNSGTNALYVALRAMEIEPFTEVIVPPITDPGGVMPVALAGFVPVPADAAPGSFNTGPEQVAERITEHTTAVVVAHIAGMPAEIDGIMDLARRGGLAVIEDCAQAHGARYKARPLGTFGDAAVFSTMSGKHHATGGQGGVVFTHDEGLYWRVRRHADRGKPFGLEGAARNVVAALNCNLDELSAAIGRAQLRKLPEIVRRRRALAAMLAERCRAELRAVRFQQAVEGAEGSYWLFFFRLHAEQLRVGKPEFVAALAAEGIPADADYLHAPALADWLRNRAVFGRSGYPWACPLYRGDAGRQYDTPNAVEANARHFRIAFHEDCGRREVDDALAALRKVETAYLKDEEHDR